MIDSLESVETNQPRLITGRQFDHMRLRFQHEIAIDPVVCHLTKRASGRSLTEAQLRQIRLDAADQTFRENVTTNFEISNLKELNNG
jgi:hypothetical protein